MARHGYRGDGAFGQFCVILPEHDTVVVTTACTLEMQAVLDAMWAHLLPGLGAIRAGYRVRARRAQRPARPPRAAGLRRRPGPGGPGRGRVGRGAVHRHRQAAAAARFSRRSPRSAWRRGGRRQITLIEPANSLTFGVGAGKWTVSAPADSHGDTIPVAASGGWLDDRTFRAEVIFLETPHRMDITCSLAGRRAEAVWRHPPLSRNSLQDLHCPS